MAITPRSGGSRTTLVAGADPASALTARRLSGEVRFGAVSRELARRVEDDVHEVVVLDDTSRLAEIADGVDAAVVAMPDDGSNLLCAQRLSVEFGVQDIVVRLSDPSNRVALADLRADTVCTAHDVSDALTETYARIVA